MTFDRRAFLHMPLALAAGGLMARPAAAQAIDQLQLFVPAAPGGGWDQTARTMETALRATGAIRTAQVTSGAGGRMR